MGALLNSPQGYLSIGRQMLIGKTQGIQLWTTTKRKKFASERTQLKDLKRTFRLRSKEDGSCVKFKAKQLTVLTVETVMMMFGCS